MARPGSLLARALQVTRQEGSLAALRAAARHTLRRLRLSDEFTPQRAAREAARAWPDAAVGAAVTKDAPKASLIILTYNNLHYTRLCLQSIMGAARAGDAPFEIIVVDNASSDGTQAYLQVFAAQHANCRLLLNDRNLGFAAGNNRGAAAARGDAIVFLNNDIIVTPGWLDGLLAHLADLSVGLVGPRTNAWGNQSRMLTRYRHLDDLLALAGGLRRERAGQSFEIDMLGFFCVALRRALYAQIGGLDERFGMGMFEDDDYAWRVRQAGYRILCAEDVFVHHWGSASFSRLGDERFRRLFDENRRKFEEKWGVTWSPPPV